MRFGRGSPLVASCTAGSSLHIVARDVAAISESFAYFSLSSELSVSILFLLQEICP